MFLLVKEGGFSSFEKELDFESYHFGPWSSEIYLDYPKTLEEIGVLKIEEEESTELDVDEIYSSDVIELREGKIKVFSLTKDGETFGKTFFERLSKEEKKKIEEIKKRWNHVALNELLNYVYFNYVKYIDRSKIREGIIPSISLEEEKEIIKKAIHERMIK